MTTLLLLKHNESVLVLEAGGDQDPEGLMSDFGPHLENWPEDLGAYEQPIGLWVWEGNAPEEGEWKGEFRDLRGDEWARLKRREKVLTEG